MSKKLSISRWKEFFKNDIWEMNLENFSRSKARFIRTARIISDTVLNLDRNNIGMLSASLCYFCMMAIVPFLAVAFALTDGIGLSDTLRQVLYSNFGTENQFVNMVLDTANNIIATAQTGGFGIVSALMFLWLIVWMMNRVEKVFNVAWGIPKPQKRRKRYLSYTIDLAILILAPFVVIVFFTGSVVYYNLLDYILPNQLIFIDSIKSFLGWLMFTFLVVLIISAMYKFIPAVKVQYRYAFKAAMISGVAFTILQYLYLETQLLVTRLNAVYGTIAAIPLLLLWLRFGWMIIVIGVQLSCSFQRLGKGIEAPLEPNINNERI